MPRANWGVFFSACFQINSPHGKAWNRQIFHFSIELLAVVCSCHLECILHVERGCSVPWASFHFLPLKDAAELSIVTLPSFIVRAASSWRELRRAPLIQAVARYLGKSTLGKTMYSLQIPSLASRFAGDPISRCAAVCLRVLNWDRYCARPAPRGHGETTERRGTRCLLFPFNVSVSTCYINTPSRDIRRELSSA